MKTKRKRSPRQLKLNPRKIHPDNSTRAEITVKLDLSSSRVADTVYKSVLPETLQNATFRSRTLLSRNGRVVELTIKAKDIVALRAASNSFLRFLAVAMKTIDIVAPFYRARRADGILNAGA